MDYTVKNLLKLSKNRVPDFDGNLLPILHQKSPKRKTLFEFFLNDGLHNLLSDEETWVQTDDLSYFRMKVSAFRNAGYDYVTNQHSGFHFKVNSKTGIQTHSINDNPTITDWDTYEKYKWNEPEDFENPNLFKRMGECLPDGMKLILHLPSGILENTIALCGYDRLCYMLADDPKLAKTIFDDVGSRQFEFIKTGLNYDFVGAAIYNDDWGFNTQIMLRPEQMREYVFPWYKKMIDEAKKYNKPTILHSCGNLSSVINDVINIGFNAKHSYEDNICPVEKWYDLYKDKLTVLGGIDIDYLCRAPIDDVYNRSLAMLNKGTKSYALGTGNSVPHYIEPERYLAMILAVFG